MQTVVSASEVRRPGMIEIAWQVRKHGALGFVLEQWRRQGDLTRLRVAGNDILFAIHPEHVRDVFVTNREQFEKLDTWEGSRQLLLGSGLIGSTGALWKRQRRLMSPFFTPRGIEGYVPIVQAASEELARRWEKAASVGEPIDVLDEMTRVTANIILRAMFGVDISEQRLRALEGDVARMIVFVSRREKLPLKAPLWTPLPSHVEYKVARARVHALIGELIARRRAQPQEAWPNDLLSKLMRARDEETGEVMSDALVHDEALGIFVAGHETTARTMGFLWWMLHENPHVKEQLHAELDEVLPRDEAPTLEHLKRLPYTLRTIKEVLRLFPPSPAMPRDVVLARDFHGVPIAPGTYVMLFPYATHRHPAFWSEPERFDPDRFLASERHPFAYFPFGGGQRVCIGNNFALLEAQVLTALLARRFDARMVEGHRPRIEMEGTLMIPNGLPMRITRRGGR